MARRTSKQKDIRQDDLSNVFTGLGQSDTDWRMATRLRNTRLTTEARNELYATNDLIARIIDVPADEAVSNWIELSGGEGQGEELDQKLEKDWARKTMTALEEGLGLKDAAREFLRRDAKDGGAFAIFVANDGAEKLSEPMGKVQLFSKLVFVDVENVQPGPLNKDYKSPLFGTPEFYKVSNVNSGEVTEIHASRCVASTGVQVSDKTKKQRKGWGESKMDRFARPVVRYQQMWEHVDATSSKFSTTFLKIAGLQSSLVQGPEGEAAIQRRLRTFSKFMSALKVAPIDADDEIAQMAVSYTGIAQILIEAREDVAAASGMPLTKLFGHAPGGLSTDDNSGRKNWAKVISALQSEKLLPFLRKVIRVFLESAQGPTKGVVPERWSIRFCPLDEPTEKEEAETEKAEAETDTMLVTASIISPKEARTRLTRDDDCRYDLDEDIEDPAQAEADAQDMLDARAKAGIGSAKTDPAPAPDPAKATGGVVAVAGNVQDTLPNGAQVAQGVEIVKRVAAGELPRDSGLGLLKVFYGLSPEDAEMIMASSGAGFEVKKPDPPPVARPAIPPGG